MHKPRFLRRVGLSVLLGSLWLAGSSAWPPTILGIGSQCGLPFGYHYAGQYTSHVEAQTQCAAYDPYRGWNGINGQLKVPASQIILGDYLIDHAAGWLGAQFAQPSGTDTWLQIGWYTGTIKDLTSNCLFGHCVRRNQSYGWYAEGMSTVGYSVYDYGLANAASTTTSRVVYNASTGCWESYLAYSGPVKLQDCTGEPISGAMFATTEMNSNSGSVVGLPTAYFGTSTPNTNQALRLHGANGWEPWDTSLLAQHTQSFDERDYVPRYVKSDLNAHFYFKAYR